MASSPALPHLCHPHGSLPSQTGLLSSSRESLSSRKSISPPFLSSSDTRVRSSRHHLLLITAQDDSFLKKGTRIFKLGGKKESNDASEAPSSGTQVFRFGARKKSSTTEEETEEEPKFGTKIFNFGSKKEAGTAKGGSIVPTALSFGRLRRQDANTVFVAGSTGQIGARIAQKLLREGFSVRGGVPDLFVAQQLAEFATQYGIVAREEAKRLNAVEFDFKNVESIAKAIGSASKVVVTVGPTEDGPKSKVTFDDAFNVIEAAKLASAGHVVVVFEPGTAASGDGPLAGLSAFFTSLFSQASALSFNGLIDQIVDSDIKYTVLKTSSTEGLDDFSPETQNLVLLAEGSSTAEGGKVSKTQVASVVAGVFTNTAVSEDKVVSVSTSPSAAASSIEELLRAIPIDGRRAVLAEARAKAEVEERERLAREEAEAEARAVVEEARKATELAAQLEAEAKKLAAEEIRAAALAEKAQAKAEAAAASVDGLAIKVKELGTNNFFSRTKASPSLNLSLPAFAPLSIKSTSKPTPSPSPPKKRAPPSPVTSVPASKPQVNNIFGGLFKQETVYIDED